MWMLSMSITICLMSFVMPPWNATEAKRIFHRLATEEWGTLFNVSTLEVSLIYSRCQINARLSTVKWASIVTGKQRNCTTRKCELSNCAGTWTNSVTNENMDFKLNSKCLAPLSAVSKHHESIRGYHTQWLSLLTGWITLVDQFKNSIS